MKKRILAIDYGTKRIGLAITDEDASYSLKLPLLHSEELDSNVQRILNLVIKNDIGRIVVGYPLSEEFGKTKMTELIDEFILSLEEKNPNLKVIRWNETLTSKAAKVNLRNTKIKNLDSEAARIILEEFLQSIQQ
jgi:putative Holliday junction resolvase